MTMTLRKSDLSNRVAARLQGTASQGESAVNAVIGAIQDALVSGNRIVITGFGSFEVRQIKERKIRPIRGANIGQQMTVPAHRRVGFSPGTELTQAVQGRRG
ncbi:MAG: HU family DNA-binding protein [Chloroflexi bacterium]|nr:HU family DNA-binding protein [Chloroflexota bacterium]